MRRSCASPREAAADVLPLAPRVGGVSYWADSAFIAAAGIPTVLFGPGGEGAHAAEEHVSLADTEAVARTLVGVAERFCA
jgi:acetylornithine deacetylase